MRIERSTGDSMNQLNNIAIFDSIDRLVHDQIVFIGSLENPPVVDVFEAVASDLLLMRGASAVFVTHGVHVGVGVEPTRAPMCVSQRYLGPMSYH